MINRKILAPSNDLFNQDYKLSYFCESLSKYEENQIKSENSNFKRSKKLKKNGIKRTYCILRCLSLFVPNVSQKMLLKMNLKKEYLIFTIKVK
jgi:hypothetical protein